MFAVVMYLAAVLRASAMASGVDKGILNIPSAADLAHCPTSCGDVDDISYPFGIGPGCFREGFELTCDHTTNPPMLFLGRGTTQVINYAESYGVLALTIGFNVSLKPGADVYNMSWETPVTGVILDEGNSLFIVGCHVKAYLFDLSKTDLVGYCMSICSNDTEIMEKANGNPCVGIGCCSIRFPRSLPAFGIQLIRHHDRTGAQSHLPNNVKVFVDVVYYFDFHLSDLYSSWLNTSNLRGTALQTVIKDQPSCESAKMSRYACTDQSMCINRSPGRGYVCECSNGLNPYIADGCIQGHFLSSAITIIFIIVSCR